MDDGSADIAREVKDITGGEMAYGATDAITGNMTGQNLTLLALARLDRLIQAFIG